MMEHVFSKAIAKREQDNEIILEVGKEDFKDVCVYLNSTRHALLRLMFAVDEREKDGVFRIYTVFSIPGKDMFYSIVLSLKNETSFPSLTSVIPAAHWYEREISDMFGLVPRGHPDPRRLVFHEAFPSGSHPLRKDWSMTEADKKEWGEGTPVKVPHPFMEVAGEGIIEIPVGPVHAGIIEPGHFRFSAVGETIFFLEPRLSYTHKGTEKHFETLGFVEGVKLAERVSGTSSFSHGAAYCMAVERMTGTQISEKAAAVRTLLLELERLYNHIGDIGN
ncbi:MAG TPA: NADH-quinone oxidoreductase subunit C, partial [Nitrospirota bacterium]|nr:NADH-quinone oxidoreductase subunit C [Nitrospirota bacterium]